MPPWPSLSRSWKSPDKDQLDSGKPAGQNSEKSGIPELWRTTNVGEAKTVEVRTPAAPAGTWEMKSSESYSTVETLGRNTYSF